MSTKVTLADFLTQIKAEIAEAQDREEIKLFNLHEISITAKFVAETSGQTGVKINLWAVTLGGEAASKGQVVHEVTLKLTPLIPVVMGEEE